MLSCVPALDERLLEDGAVVEVEDVEGVQHHLHLCVCECAAFFVSCQRSTSLIYRVQEIPITNQVDIYSLLANAYLDIGLALGLALPRGEDLEGQELPRRGVDSHRLC